MTLRICFVAGPLIARSGVYNSAIDLVEGARARGLEWTAVIGVAPTAKGDRAQNKIGLHEFDATPQGVVGVRGLRATLLRHQFVRSSDLVISLTPQTDMALAATSLKWVAYLRGLPWPARGEASAVRTAVWRGLERLALLRASGVWTTTTILAEEAGMVHSRLVPPGIAKPAAAISGPPSTATEFVWAARYSEDKNPWLFLEAMANTSARGVMFGTGPLETALRQKETTNVSIGGWRSKAELWRTARAYVGTSYREAFGRSAVEAAMLGLPVILSDRFGCAPMLYTDPSLAQRFVLSTRRPQTWSAAIEELNNDEALRDKVAAHVSQNARALTIDNAVRNVEVASADAISKGAG